MQITLHAISKTRHASSITELLYDGKRVSDKLLTLKSYFPHFEVELKRPEVTHRLLWEEYLQKHPRA